MTEATRDSGKDLPVMMATLLSAEPIMTNLFKLPTWADAEHVHAVVETPRGSSCKLDYDPKLKVFTLAKPLMAGLSYPYDWGFLPSTEAEDGDPLDRARDPRFQNLPRRGAAV